MRKTLYILLLLNNILLAQGKKDKKIYLDSLKRETKETGHHFYRIIKDYRLDQKEYQVSTYYKSGKLEEEKTIAYKEDHQGSSGTITQFYENGNQKHLFIPYNTNDSIQSRTIDYFEDGIKSSELVATHKGKKATLYEYYPNGKQKMIKALDYEYPNTLLFSKTLEFWDKDGNKTITNGNGKYIYDDQDKSITGEIKDGKKVNIWIEFDKKTERTNTIHYNEQGYFLKGETVFKSGEKRSFSEYEAKPIPKKGYQHFSEYMSKNFNPTLEAFKNKVSGKIILEFVVEKDGSITEIKLIKGLGFGLDEEAIRLLDSYEDWYPCLIQGEAVRARSTFPLTINLK